ncbi:MAG: hypothetical protein JWO44_1422 [Bacteroidetes bacterium]|nr:hypothetical protein [Bacteroidota bacterium]
MNKQACFFIACISLLLCSCFRGRDATERPQAVPFRLESKSPLLRENDFKLSLDSVNHTLFITIAINLPKNFAFPLNKKYGDTLTKTAFDLTFYFNGQAIKSDYVKTHSFNWNDDSPAAPGILSISSDTTDLRGSQELQFQIPFYAFHELKKGKRSVVLKISEHLFTAAHIEEKKGNAGMYDSTVYLTDSRPLLSMSARFDLDVPPVHESIIYGYGLVLRNDSTFSPSGMDNTIFKSSLPDIYWMLYYPVGEFYAKTDYQTSTDAYNGKDTFRLYHYYAADSIGIGVYDHDNLSRDDGLGSWTGPLEKLSVHKINRINFGYVKSFDVKAEKKGIVN